MGEFIKANHIIQHVHRHKKIQKKVIECFQNTGEKMLFSNENILNLYVSMVRII